MSEPAIQSFGTTFPTSILADFGVHDDLGVQFFFESGLV